MEHVGELIRRMRDEAGMTQEELAIEAGVSPTTLVRIEKGAARPRGKTLAKISAALGVEPGELVSFHPPGLDAHVGMGPFSAVFQHDGEWWTGHIEELPGANSQERTLEETRASLKEAIELVLEANRELTRVEFEGEVVREALHV